jgi:plastocyanin
MGTIRLLAWPEHLVALGAVQWGKTMQTIDVWLREFEIEPREIDVKAGERVRFRVHNSGFLEHDLVADGTELGVFDVASGETRIEDFTFEEPGVFETVCHLGHEGNRMMGLLVVQES